MNDTNPSGSKLTTGPRNRDCILISPFGDLFLLTRSISNDTALSVVNDNNVRVIINVVWFVKLERQITKNEVAIVMVIYLMRIPCDVRQ